MFVELRYAVYRIEEKSNDEQWLFVHYAPNLALDEIDVRGLKGRFKIIRVAKALGESSFTLSPDEMGQIEVQRW